jgi:hypothetical protein
LSGKNSNSIIICTFAEASKELTKDKKKGSSDKCVVFVPKRWIEMKIAKILSLPLVTPN